MNWFRTRHLVSLSESRGAVSAKVSRSAPPTLDKHLMDYARVLVRRRWTVGLALGVVLAVAALHLYTAVPIYEATAQILIEHENKEQFSLQAGVAADRETTDYYNTQYTILQSRSLAGRAIDGMAAWKSPELTNGDLRPQGMIGGVGGWMAATLKRLRGFQATRGEPVAVAPSKEPTSSAALETPAQSRAIGVFLSRLTIAPVKTSRLVDVKFQAADAKFAATAANALTKAYIEQNLEVRMTSSKETSDWLTEQLAAQRDRISTSENALQRYRENHDAVSLSDRQNIVTQKLSTLNEMVTRAKGDRISREAIYNQMREIQQRAAPLDTLPSALSNSYLSQLKSDLARFQAEYSQRSLTLGDQNPVMVGLKASIDEADAKLQRELAKQIDVARNELDGARALETSLTSALEQQKREVTAMDRTGIDYSSLEREVTSNRQIFDSLLARTREKSIAGDLKASEVRVIDAAQIPSSPIWPKFNETVLYAAFFGSIFGVALAFFFEYVDDRIKTPDEIKMYLGLPFLGVVPVIEKNEAPEQRPLLHRRESVSPMFSEAFRAVRTNVIFSAEERAPSIVVTSTGPGEGKTVVSSNLAIGLALTGRRVLLLDVDMRCPQVHELFEVEAQPGLSDILTGTSSVANAIRPTAVPGLSVMPSGGKTLNPSELLSSPRFGKLLALLAQQFQWVIIDSPPVAAVTDSCIVANRASAVLFVVGAERTARGAALNAIEQLEQANATFLGSVLNRVHLKRDAFYYSRYYRPSYEKYYVNDGVGGPASDQFDGDDLAVSDVARGKTAG